MLCGERGEKNEFMGTVCGLKAVEAAKTGRGREIAELPYGG